jgi:peptide/nickel transport system substrate-binding protein
MDGSAPVDTAIYEDVIPGSIVAEEKRFRYTLRNQTILHRLLFGLVLPRHDVAGSDLVADWSDRMWVSGGPFILDEWVQGDYLRLVRNDRYWKTDPVTGQALPYLDSVVFRFLDADELVPALVNGVVDVITVDPTPEVLATLDAAGDIVVDVRAGTAWEHLNFQFGERRFERNPDSVTELTEFRQAVLHAIDRERIVNELLPERATGIDSYANVYVPGLSDGPWKEYAYDPNEARRLLGEVCDELDRDCATDPLEVVFTTTADNPARTRLAEELGTMLTTVGLDYRAELEESPVFLGDTLPLGRWDLAQWAYRATPGYVGLVSIHDVIDPDGPPPYGRNLYRLGTGPVVGAEPYDQGGSAVRDGDTERLAELRDLMNATIDPEEINALVLEAERILADRAIFLPLFVWRELGAARTSLGGYRFNPTDASDTWNLESWYVTGG